MAGSAAIVLVVFAEPLLHLWTQDYELAKRTAPILSLLALGNLLNGLMWVPYQMQLAHGWASLTIRINIVAVACIVPAVLLVTPQFGAEGAAWVWVGLTQVIYASACISCFGVYCPQKNGAGICKI